ncbi:hypothetical protein [Spirosoma flavum]|uniref:Anti-sigma factor n=1 Tax=Spirosoma flavum TaxID=2048557 RepID=A0ABW6AMQ1_9BACT
MKTINSVALLLFTLLALGSCTPKMNFSASSIAPAATGDVKVKKDKNKNYLLQVNVRNLAEPQKLNPAKNKYLVWMESDDNSVSKLGQITPYSKILKGELKATTTSKPNQVFITAEDNADGQYPDGQIVLTTKK